MDTTSRVGGDNTQTLAATKLTPNSGKIDAEEEDVDELSATDARGDDAELGTPNSGNGNEKGNPL